MEGGPSRRLATDEHGKTRKEAEAEEQAKDLPRINTEFHGNKPKQKINTETRPSKKLATEGGPSRRLATDGRHIFQSRMRERRYKYIVWGGPLRQAQGPGFLRYGQ